jgi:hypothetical protein
MEMLPLATILANNASREELFSALPNAPVVPYVERRSRAVRPRAALARVLERAAQVVAPPAPAPIGTCHPAH